VRLWFHDEARFGRISDRRRCWAPLPDRPVVPQQVVREYVYVLGAASPFDGRFCSLVLPWVDADAMSMFLAHLAAETPGEYGVVVLDGAGWHTAHALRVPSALRLIFLPPYSPELNPIEHVWDHLRENDIGHRIFDSLDEVSDTLCVALRRLIDQPGTVHSLTCFEWLNTLRLMSN